MRTGWRDRPVLAPLIYGTSFFVTGGMSFVAGYLLMSSIRSGVFLALFMYVLLALYFYAGYCAAQRRRDDL